MKYKQIIRKCYRFAYINKLDLVCVKDINRRNLYSYKLQDKDGNIILKIDDDAISFTIYSFEPKLGYRFQIKHPMTGIYYTRSWYLSYINYVDPIKFEKLLSDTKNATENFFKNIGINYKKFIEDIKKKEIERDFEKTVKLENESDA